MREEIKKGSKLYDIYFRLMVEFVDKRYSDDPKYPIGWYYTVKYSSGVVNTAHESSFSRPWLRRRDKKGHFVKGNVDAQS